MASIDKVLARPLAEQLLRPELLNVNFDQLLAADPLARARMFPLLALERQRLAEYHSAYRGTADASLKVTFGEIARIEQQQSVRLSLLEGDLSPLERAQLYEHAALDCFIGLAQEEPDANVRTGFEYIVLEVLEHAWHVAEASKASGSELVRVAAGWLSHRRGRPLDEQYLTAFDAVKTPYDHLTVDPLTQANVRLGAAVARGLEETYRRLTVAVGAASSPENDLLLATLARIAQVKEIHAALIESFIDPWESALASAVAGEYAEALFYRRALAAQTEPAIVEICRHNVADEVGHLTLLTEQLARREGRDLTYLLEMIDYPAKPTRPAVEYIPALIETQLSRRSKGKSYVDIGKTLEAFS